MPNHSLGEWNFFKGIYTLRFWGLESGKGKLVKKTWCCLCASVWKVRLLYVSPHIALQATWHPKQLRSLLPQSSSEHVIEIPRWVREKVEKFVCTHTLLSPVFFCPAGLAPPCLSICHARGKSWILQKRNHLDMGLWVFLWGIELVIFVGVWRPVLSLVRIILGLRILDWINGESEHTGQ